MDGSRRALVTGGAVRVGRAVALALAEAGWDVAVHCRSSVDAAGEVAERIRGLGRSAAVVRGDLARPEQIPEVVGDAAAALGGLDLLVNNAAVFPRHDPDTVSAEAWDAVFAVNTRAPFFCAREAARRMGDRGGCVINVTDAAASAGWPEHAPYAASKAALVSVTRSLARAWAPRVRVNGVAPGPVLLPEGASEEERREAIARTALGRLGRPADVAEAVLYLAGADYVTGEVLRIDGGAALARPSEPA